MTRGRSFKRSAGTKRLTEWTSSVPEAAFTALAGASAIIDNAFTTPNVETLIRCRGLLVIQSNQIAAAEQPFGAIGLCLVTDQAFAAGAGSIPLPYTDSESDAWLLHQFWAAPFQFGDGTGFARIDAQYQLDSKAMRRVTQDDTVLMVLEVGSAAAIGVNYRWDMRLLTKVA